MRCARCGSAAINPHLHGRDEGLDLDLCDVCYWRSRHEALSAKIAKLDAVGTAARALVAAMDVAEPGWRETTLGTDAMNGDGVNAAWDRLVAAVEGAPK